MQFSLWNFKDWFIKEQIDLTYQISSSAAAIHGVAFWEAEFDRIPGTAYVCEGTTINQPLYSSVLFFGNDWMGFPTTSVSQLINSANRMIEAYSDWEFALYNCTLNKGHLSTLLDLSRQILPYPIAFFTETRGILHATSDWELHLGSDSIGELMNDKRLQQQPIFKTISKDEKIHHLFVQAISCNDEKMGLLILHETATKFTPGILSVTDILKEAILSCCRISSQVSTSRGSIDHFFKDALLHGFADTKKLQLLLHAKHWHEQAYFTLYYIEAEKDDSVLQRDILLAKLKECFVFSSSFLHEHAIILITYSRLDALSDINRQIQRLVPAKSFYIGQSLSTQDIYNIREYYRQAQLAAIKAKELRISIFQIQNMLSEAISTAFQSNPWVQTFVHPDLITLSNADKVGNDELLHTLYLYLICGKNNNATAEALYIHRNTLRCRLEKIHNLIQSDLTKEQEVQQLLASFLIFSPKEQP